MKRYFLSIFTIISVLFLITGCGGASFPTADVPVAPAGLGQETNEFIISCKDQDGTPMEGVRLQLCNDSICIAKDSDADGLVCMNSADEEYELKVLSAPEGYTPESEEEITAYPGTTEIIFLTVEDVSEIADGSNAVLSSALSNAASSNSDFSSSIQIQFATTDLHRNKATEDIFSGHAVTLCNIWEPWCGPCVREMPELEELYEEYDDEAFAIVGFTNMWPNMGYTPKDVVKQLNITYPVLNYPPSLDELFTIDAVPTSFFVDENGYILPVTTDMMNELICDERELGYSWSEVIGSNGELVGALPKEAWQALIDYFLD